MDTANLDIFGVLPMGCVIPRHANFYLWMRVKTLAPLVVIALFWIRPVYLLAVGRQQRFSKVARQVAQLSICGLEFLLPSISTTIVSSMSM